MSQTEPPAPPPDLAGLAELLLGAPGMDCFPELFPRLSDRHLDYLADPDKTPRASAAALAVVDGPFGLGPLTASELEPWTARELGGSGAPSAANIAEADRAQVLELTGGLLPILERFRKRLVKTHGHFPDVLQGAEAERYRAHLEGDAAARAVAAERFAAGVPAELRVPLHKLFTEAHDYAAPVVMRDSVAPMSGLAEGEVGRFLDAARWLHLLPGAPGREVPVPYPSIPGLLIRAPRFAQ